MVAARPRLSHNLQADGEEEPVFQPKSWVSSRQGSLSRDTRSRGRSAAGLPFSVTMPQSLRVQLGLLGKPRSLPMF